MKKLFCILFALTGAFNLAAQEEKVPWQKDITMLMVPRDPVVVQVARDIAQNYPVLLVCYQQIPEAETPLLHAWDGSDWVSVTLKNYTNGTFFATPPQHTVIVEDEGQPAPDVLIPDESWCDSGNRLSSTDTRVLIHLLGRHFNLPYQYWMQFSRRYDYPLKEINPSLLNVSREDCRNHKVDLHFGVRDMERDMDKWTDLYNPEPEPVEPVVDEEQPVDPQTEPSSEEILEELTALMEKEPEDAAENPAQPAETEDAAENPVQRTDNATQTPEEKSDESEPDPIAEKDTSPAEDEVDPFSTNNIPAAEVIVKPAE